MRDSVICLLGVVDNLGVPEPVLLGVPAEELGVLVGVIIVGVLSPGSL